MSKQRLRVYVAGPISQGDLYANIHQARQATVDLVSAGFAPLCPHLTCFLESDEPSRTSRFNPETWYEVDLPWVEVSDAVLRLPGDSVGAYKEVAHALSYGIPVYYSVSDLIKRPPVKGDERFHFALRQLSLLHDRKQKDYGSDADPFANIRASEAIGIPAWKGCWLRARDKVKRIDTYCNKGSLANEGVIDSFQDLAVYATIARILFSEHQEKSADVAA